MFVKTVSEEEKKRQRQDEKLARREKLESVGPVAVLKVLLLPAIFAAIVACMLYAVMQSKLQAAELKTSVVVATQSISANTFIEAEEFEEYFEVVSVELEAVAATTYASLEELPAAGFYVQNALAVSQIIYTDDISKTDNTLGKYRSGYQITSFSVSNFASGVNGALRKGDIVNVYAQDLETGELVLMAENIYVYEVYDSNGVKIADDDDESVATSFTVYVADAEVEALNFAIVCGGIQMYLIVE